MKIGTTIRFGLFGLLFLPAVCRALDPLQSAHGRVTVLAFVRTDCPISSRYAPILQSLAAKYSGRTNFWLIFPQPRLSVTALRKYQRAYGYKLPAWRDPLLKLAKRSQATVTPEVAVFDASGGLVYHGRIDDSQISLGQKRPAPTTHELADAIESAIAGKHLAVSSTIAVGCYIADLR